MRDLLFVGIHGHAVALDRATGQEVWRTKLKGTDFVTLAVEGNELFAGSRGELFCLEAKSGRILWHNPLKGLGWGLVSVSGNVASTAAASTRRRAQAASHT